MKTKRLANVRTLQGEIYIFDIDGTLKDLVKEHKSTLKTCINLISKSKKVRKKVVLYLDKMAMYFVKGGVLPTNVKMQRILTAIYAFILNENQAKFSSLYNDLYNNENIIFEEAKDLLVELVTTKQVYFVTINNPKFNWEEYGVCADKIIYKKCKSKFAVYKKLFDEKDFNKSDTIIIGDNIFDDIKSAKKLGVDALLVDNYDSKLKRFIAKILNVGM